MTNMSQAPATEKKGVSDLLGFKIFGMPLPLYAFALITLLLSHFFNALPTDLVGGFAIMFIIGAIFGEIGKRLDFLIQEAFREINTCGNKLPDVQLSRMVVDFKNELEKCREQVQNLE